jgi:pyruvate formate-lyase activating enzyme-like uncharacterized protein
MVRSATGCKLCAKGAKLVLLVSGKCDRRCFYCPISEKKKDKDVIYANERPVTEDSEIIEEALRMNALGTGITGGEPLLFLSRTLHFMDVLKNEFGEKHHIHLYTTKAINAREAELLHSHGLDEIRFHMVGKGYTESIDLSKRAGMSVGVELPAIAIYEKKIEEAISSGIDFLNLNELEFSETNRERMNRRGYDTENGISATGSASFARRMVRRYGRKVPINFCSSNFKDGVQLRRRLLRTAENTAEMYERVTEDGTIVRGVIEGLSVLKIPENIPFEVSGDKIYTDPDVLRHIPLPKGAVAYVSEVYPTWDELEVEREYIDGRHNQEYMRKK